MKSKNFEVININGNRLHARMNELSKIGALEGGGVCRLALTDEDKEARDLLLKWMEAAKLEIKIDGIGNMYGIREGKTNAAPVWSGSHLDTVGTGGCYDGSLGVLAALEVIETMNDQGIITDKPVGIINFTNEEGVRFTPDMMGSLVLKGGMPLDEVLAIRSVDGKVVLGEELKRIGYAGDFPMHDFNASAFIELHIEQGPVLEKEDLKIGAVTSVQGISWTEFTIHGQASHAGATPMHLRKDAGYACSSIIQFVRDLTNQVPGKQVATSGLIEVYPNLINVVPEKVKMTVDLRNTEEEALQEAEKRLKSFINNLEIEEKVKIESRQLVRFEPEDFNEKMVELIFETAGRLGLPARKIPSGAGHDAQMMNALCPTSMIFIPSVNGISHNVNEYSKPVDVEAGADVLLNTVLKLASGNH